MFKKLFFLALAAGIMAALAALVYNKLYFTANEVDFSKIVNPVSIFGSCITGCILASGLYWLLKRFLKDKTDIVFNLVFAILTFASILSPIGQTLPLDIKQPELFPGLAVPMHFLPLMAWLVLKPIFIRNTYLKIN